MGRALRGRASLVVTLMSDSGPGPWDRDSAYSLLIQDGDHVDEGHNHGQQQASGAGVPAEKTHCRSAGRPSTGPPPFHTGSCSQMSLDRQLSS